LHQDLPQDLIDDIMTFFEQFPKAMEDFEGLITENRIFKQRNVNIGVVDEKTIMDYAFTGPMVRGSGLAWDLRRSQPYEIYSEIPQDVFPVIIGKNGDNYDRYVVRMEEMQVSNNIMKWCIENMPKGPVMAENSKVAPPRRGEMKRSMEALIHHFKLYTEGFHVPAGEVYAAVEAPAGEFGVYLVADGTNRPYRVKLRAPSFAHLAAMDHLCKGHQLADTSTILGSLDIVFGEVDR
jgi:NADH-quinone oxidoreductase subunit D